MGATEAAALFRSFGLRARIADFGVVSGQSAEGAGGATRTAAAAGGGSTLPVHPNVQCDGCGAWPIVGDRFKSESRPNYDLCAACQASPTNAAVGPFRRVLPGGSLGAGEAGPAGAGGIAAGAAAGSQGSASMVAQQLLLWVWQYFASEDGSGSSGGSAEGMAAREEEGKEQSSKRPRLQHSAVRLSGKCPLYFQVVQPGM